MLTYTTRPRGGAVHAIRLAEELHRLGVSVHLFALGDPKAGFFRTVQAPHTVWRAPSAGGSLEDKIFASIDVLTECLAAVGDDFDIAHAQDCISARAAVASRRPPGEWVVVRTVHHIDDFTTETLVQCQHRSVLDPDIVCVVSDFWRRRLIDDYGVSAQVVPNGVDLERFSRPAGFDRSRARRRLGLGRRFVFLAVGGIEPRKGSIGLIEALGSIPKPDRPTVAILGGHSFRDYAEYRSRATGLISELGLELGLDLILAGTIADSEFPKWFWASDGFVFPSHKEGWGLALAEALAASLPSIASDLPVFREFLTDQDVVFVPLEGSEPLAEAMQRMMSDKELRTRLSLRGPQVVSEYTWERSARIHEDIYRRALRSSIPSRS